MKRFTEKVTAVHNKKADQSQVGGNSAGALGLRLAAGFGRLLSNRLTSHFYNRVHQSPGTERSLAYGVE